jgi:hypothetical protein
MYSTNYPHDMNQLFIFKIKIIDLNYSKLFLYKYLVIHQILYFLENFNYLFRGSCESELGEHLKYV